MCHARNQLICELQIVLTSCRNQDVFLSKTLQKTVGTFLYKKTRSILFFGLGKTRWALNIFYETKNRGILWPQTSPGFEVKTFDPFLKRRIALVDVGENFKLILFGGMMDGKWYFRRILRIFFVRKNRFDIIWLTWSLTKMSIPIRRGSKWTTRS